MQSKKFTCLISCAVLSMGIVASASASAQMNPDRFLQRWDANGDGQVSKNEFGGKRRPFSDFDKNGDGVATREEIEAVFGGRANGGINTGGGIAGPRLEGQVPAKLVGRDLICAIARYRNCDGKLAVDRGLFPTGLRPTFPDGFVCHGIDEPFAKDYSGSRGREAYHGGIDMPANYGTPMLAIANGMVLTNVDPQMSARGKEVIIRHTPEDTGIPLYIYSQYAHLDERSALKPGARVKMGDVVGPTGNSGSMPLNSKAGAMRRPAIHFAIWFSDKPDYAIDPQGNVVPKDGWWMDPTAVYRLSPPFDSDSMKALPDANKWVRIPVMIEGGGTQPAGTRLIWPYACRT